MPGGTSNATRSPATTPCASNPAAIRSTSSWRSRNVTEPMAPSGPISTTATSASFALLSSADHALSPGSVWTRVGSSRPSVATHACTGVATSASSGSRCEAPMKRWTSAWGSRASRSWRYRSENTGSEGPHSRSTGTSAIVSSEAATSSRAAMLGWSGSSGMSRTNVPIARRRPVVRYGARYALLIAGSGFGLPRARVPLMKPVVDTATVSRTPLRRTARINDGALAPSGWWTAVFMRTIPASWARCRAAQPIDIGPPQSWATVTTGPSRSRASVRAPRSAIRVRRRRTVPVRSEKPMSSWSTATTRTPGGADARRLLHTYDHVGFPCTHSSVTSGSATPLSRTCQLRPTPSSVGVSTILDHEGSSPSSPCGGSVAGSSGLAVTTRFRSPRRSSPIRCQGTGCGRLG